MRLHFHEHDGLSVWRPRDYVYLAPPVTYARPDSQSDNLPAALLQEADGNAFSP